MNTAVKNDDLMAGIDLVSPILGIAGLPQDLTNFALTVTEGYVEIDCSFYVEKQLLDRLTEAWEPAFARYRLLKIEQPESTAEAAALTAV